MPARHWLYFGGFVLSTVALIGAGVIGLVEGLAALATGVPATAVGLVAAVLGAAAEWIGITLVLALLAAAFLAASAVSVLRAASLPRDDRLASVVEWLERRYPPLRRLDASEKVAPTPEDRRRKLRQRYVEGELTEAEFERRLDRLLDDTADRSETVTDRTERSR